MTSNGLHDCQFANEAQLVSRRVAPASLYAQLSHSLATPPTNQ